MLPQNQCTGCFACKAACPVNCISEAQTAEGFYYPQISLKSCINCKKCESVCPVLSKAACSDHHAAQPEAHGAYSLDPEIRQRSSSGGVFSELARHILAQNGVVYGAELDRDELCRHVRISELNELGRLRGAKYLQSRLADCYSSVQRDLDSGKKVLFAGTPCQVAGILRYLKKPYTNLLTIDFVCHGVGSPKAFACYREELEKTKRSELTGVSFRDKHSGWKNYSVALHYADGSLTHTVFGTDPYMKAYLSNLSLRSSCFDCAFKSLNRCSDLTLADYWGLDKLHPQYDDDLGCSFVLLHSEAGQSLFSTVLPRLFVFDASTEALIRYNPACIRSVSPNPFRAYFFSRLGKRSFSKLTTDSLQPSFAARLYRKLFTRH